MTETTVCDFLRAFDHTFSSYMQERARALATERAAKSTGQSLEQEVGDVVALGTASQF